MDVLGPLIHVVLRSLVVLFPLTVGWLAFRRLAHSKTSNAWIYAAICLFSAVAAAGVLPWTLGLTELNWFPVILALISPMIWICAIMACDLSRTPRYGRDPLVETARSMFAFPVPKPSPLVLRKPVTPETPTIEFKHQAPKPVRREKTREIGHATKTLLNLARDIRGNPTSDRHRPKLLPSPDSQEMPFLRKSSGA